MRVDYRFPKYPRISPECRDLIQRILVREPDQRLTIQQIQEHPWCARLLSAFPSGNVTASSLALTMSSNTKC